MKVTLVVPSLSSGGAERVMSIMANHWSRKGWRVTLITLSGRDDDFFALDEKVERIALDIERPSSGMLTALANNFRRFRKLRKCILDSEADAVISFVDKMNVLTLLSTRFAGVPVIVSERVDPRMHDIGYFWGVMRRVLYSMATALVVQTRSVIPWAESIVSGGKVKVIPNPVAISQRSEGAKEFPEPFVLAAGRLTHQKGFDLLLEAFWKNSSRYPEWNLVILGEGEERAHLERLASNLGIRDKVHLPGRHNGPWGIMNRASMFVLSSRFEGFPNVLIEAMSCGLPVISFNCPSGPAEIVRDQIDGVLVEAENADALAEAMGKLMGDSGERKRLGKRAAEIADRYCEKGVMDMWEECLRDCERINDAS